MVELIVVPIVAILVIIGIVWIIKAIFREYN